MARLHLVLLEYIQTTASATQEHALPPDCALCLHAYAGAVIHTITSCLLISHAGVQDH